MIPQHLAPLFWDINPAAFDPSAYPEYTIARVLEYGDRSAVEWLRQTFPKEQIIQVIRDERRLSEKSATFWALVYKIAREDVAALRSPVG
jgi:hypothetical protein